MTRKTGMSTRIPKKTVILTEVGLRLRSERLRMSLNQDEFGDFAGVTRNSQALYEGGKSPFGIDYLMRLADEGIDIGYIVTGVRDDGSIDAMDNSLLDKFKALNDEQKTAIVHLLGVMSGQPTLNADDLAAHRGRTLHSPALTFRSKPKDLE